MRPRQRHRPSSTPAAERLHGARACAAVALAATALAASLALTLAGCSAVAALLPAPAPSEVADTAAAAAVTTPRLTVGDCLNDLGTAAGAAIPLAPCAAPHGFEVYQVFAVSGDKYPGDDAVTAAAESGCATRFDAFAGVAYQGSALDFAYRTPEAASWPDTGGHDVSCLIYDPAGWTTGSLAGAAR